MTRTNIPLTGRQIATALALTALQGGITGWSTKGPEASGRAASTAMQTAQQQQAERAQAEAQQAQNDAKSQQQALSTKASLLDLNARTILTSAQAEAAGLQNMKAYIDQNADTLSSYNENQAVEQSHVSQADLQKGMADGTIQAHGYLAIPDGYIQGTDENPELTYSLVHQDDANTKTVLSGDPIRKYADAGVPGFQAFRGGAPGSVVNMPVPSLIRARADSMMSAIDIMQSDSQKVIDQLKSSLDPNTAALASKIPDLSAQIKNPDSGGSLVSSLLAFQRYISHSDYTHGGDFYEQLQQMAEPSKPDPNHKGQFIPNPDAQQAQRIAQAFSPDGTAVGGWKLLQTAHNESLPTPVVQFGIRAMRGAAVGSAQGDLHGGSPVSDGLLAGAANAIVPRTASAHE